MVRAQFVQFALNGKSNIGEMDGLSLFAIGYQKNSPNIDQDVMNSVIFTINLYLTK